MALTRELIVDTAMGILREYGLADLSMRRLARDLGVQPGALYWHVKNKQELLTVLAGLILAPADTAEAATVEGSGSTGSGPRDSGGGAQQDIRHLALRIRAALLAVRDGAEVVALAHALAPETPSPLLHLTTLLAASGLSPRHSEWAAGALVHYVVGSATQEQTRAGLFRAGLLADEGTDTDAAFGFGLDLFLAGLPGPANHSQPDGPQAQPAGPAAKQA
ncbi:TetR family transcriptional regulator [Arthrobacter livingstonensis]|uniref:TetR family transcriptional regulator n=1 Tax=Arthrobacter livingstonensis TaxID=670078 RepID=A0A2V5LDB9_9MICC|nr:TetR/AcrR family transcriptional regulator C-terminal domain-containing protein [Arthrobacter livingstonensis]PYI69448.1 TetR family transcriptional regulator [Arthrobacter livingstonensis]